MTIINKLSVSVIALFIVSVMFLTMPQDVYAGTNGSLIGCCQFDGREEPAEMALNSEVFECADDVTSGECSEEGGMLILGATCNESTGMCSGGVRDVPTMSEWGLIGTAVVLGFIGFIYVRRRKATA